LSVDTNGIVDLLADGFNLPPKKGRTLLIRLAWVSFVTGHILWVCGWLAWMGVASPFARASDFDTLQQNAALSATIAVQRELRDEYAAQCVTADPVVRVQLDHYIDVLQAQYHKLTNTYYPDPGCKNEIRR
jgi:hypothetical protein